MRLIDSHCHLNYAGLAERQEEVLASARARGVTGFLNISTRQSEWDDVLGAAERNSDVWATVGVHPHEADAHPDLGAAALVEAASHPRVIAIGECGLDYHYDNSERGRPARALRGAYRSGAPKRSSARGAHSRRRGRYGRRSSAAPCGKGASPGVLHCFTGTADLARKALDLGFYISLSGIVTFKNARTCRRRRECSRRTGCWSKRIHPSSRPSRIAARLANRPSLPTRRSSWPSFVRTILRTLADTTTANFFRLFSRATA